MEDYQEGSGSFELTAATVGSLTVSRLTRIVSGREDSIAPDVLRAMELDKRSGVTRLALRLRKRLSARIMEESRLEKLCRYERSLWERGRNLVAGLDEAGAGPLAGPVVAAAVILPPGFTLPGVDDSKKLSARKRELLASQIIQHAVSFAFGEASPLEIDRVNIFQASLLAMRRAVLGLDATPEHLLIDARRIPGIDLPQTPITGGDAVSFSIASASILAKTRRDEMMRGLDKKYPGYGFARHKGYPTAEHRQALRRLGPTPEHRKSFTLIPGTWPSATEVPFLIK